MGADNLRKVESNPETKRTVINLDAEVGSYLITIGPVEPNKMAKAKATILDDQGYAAWEAALENSTEEETAEEPAAEPENENAEEKPGEPEAEAENEPVEEQSEEPETEPAEELTEEIVEEKDEEPEEETIGKPEEELTEEQTNELEEETTEKVAEEKAANPELPSDRSIQVDVSWDVSDPMIGDTAHFKAILEGYDGLEYTMQWQYSPDDINWHDIPNETNTTMDVVVTPENNVVYWRILVYVEDDQES